MAGTLTVGNHVEGEEKVQTTNWYHQAAKAVVASITQRS